MDVPKAAETLRPSMAHIGKSVVIQGEVTGSEDLYLDGEVQGTIELRGHSLTIGPNGRIRANVAAKEIVVQGKVEGSLHASDRLELKRSAHVIGDVMTQRIVIEDGAYFKGGIDIQKEAPKEVSKEAPKDIRPEKRDAVPATTSVAAGMQGSLLETAKK